MFMKDVIDKYYQVCQLFDDDLNKVSDAIKRASKVKRPKSVLIDLEDLRVYKYEVHLDLILRNPTHYMIGQLRFEF